MRRRWGWRPVTTSLQALPPTGQTSTHSVERQTDAPCDHGSPTSPVVSSGKRTRLPPMDTSSHLQAASAERPPGHKHSPAQPAAGSDAMCVPRRPFCADMWQKLLGGVNNLMIAGRIRPARTHLRQHQARLLGFAGRLDRIASRLLWRPSASVWCHPVPLGIDLGRQLTESMQLRSVWRAQPGRERRTNAFTLSIHSPGWLRVHIGSPALGRVVGDVRRCRTCSART